MSVRENEQTFACFEWQPRWNGTRGPVASVIVECDHLIATGPMGTIHIKVEDVLEFINQMKPFLNLLEKEAKQS